MKTIYIIFYSISIVFSLSLKNDIYDNSYALVIGINDYNEIQNLNYAAEDAFAIKNLLINSYNFSRKNVKTLIDKEATQSNIKRELSNIMKMAGPNDRVVFYFAGHGETQELGLDQGDIGFLMPVDGSADDLYFTAIDMEELKRISKFSKAKHMLFLLDACYGGLAAVNTRSLSINTPNYIDKISVESARQIITAGGKDEKVIEKDEWGHSAFTKNILTALKDKKADSNKDGYITGTEIGIYLQEKVSFDTDNFQTPQSRRLTTHEGEIIFLVDNYENENSDLKKSSDDKINELQKLVEELAALQLKQNSGQNYIKYKDNQRVIKSGSIGLYALDPTKEIKIESIFLRPTGLVYKARMKLYIDLSDEESWGREMILELDQVLEIPGESNMGIYDYNTGLVN
tara:strand:+ start:1545 stop:2747 length:1203 start_codon:yes stop_codon:yes gene_type:complete